MGENLKGVSLNVGSNSVRDRISEILTEVSLIDDLSKRLAKLDSYIHSIEEEVRKIDAFKRELPYSMDLLIHAIEKLKEESLEYKRKEKRTVSEEFILLKSDTERNGRAKWSNDFNGKNNWMSSAQLWNTPIKYQNYFDFENQDYVMHQGSLRYQGEEGSGSGGTNRFHGSNFYNTGGAFMPYKKEKRAFPVHNELALSIVPVAKVEQIDLNARQNSEYVRYQLQHPEHQKSYRRCWSSDLHEKFVNALDQLGGAHLATPKQIRQLMEVDGLTNDEVKSHLQKYRIHIKKLPTASAGPSNNSGSSQGPSNHGDGGDADQGGASSTGGGDSMEKDS